MDILKIDKNFVQEKVTTEGGVKLYALPSAPFELYGVFYDEKEGRFLRMPKEIAAATSGGVDYLNKNTAGGRVRFSTDSDYLELRVTYSALSQMPHMPHTGSSGFALLEETENGSVFTNLMRPLWTEEKGFTAKIPLWGGKMRQYTLYFPLYNDVESVAIGVKENAQVAGGKKYKDVKPVLYYGSSITQGGCASRPDNSYQGFIAKWTNTDYINLGFSGNGKAEPIMAEYLASIDCSVFVCDYDHNAPNPEHLEATHEPLYRTFRKSHPTTPIVFISKPDHCTDPINDARRAIIAATYEKAKTEGDENVYFIDGETLFMDGDRESCTIDGCHPNDLGFYRMARVIGAKLGEIDEAFRF